MAHERIPFLEFGAMVDELRDELDSCYHRVMDRGWFLFGPELEAFEREFANYCEAGSCRGVGSGLSALSLILEATGVGANAHDEVIVPSNTYIATWLSVTRAGARPVPVEPRLETRNLNPELVEQAITPKTRAIITTHLFGAPSEMGELQAIARSHNLPLFVDAAQSVGSAIAGSRAATLGDASAFSFYPTKNLGAFGDAGAVVSERQDIIESVQLLRHYGMHNREDHPLQGENSRMEELQAAFLCCKLKHLDRWTARRAEIACYYYRELSADPQIGLPQYAKDSVSAWHLFTVTVPDRERVRAKMAECGVETDVHYPVPPHLSAAYRGLGYQPGDFPVAEQLARSLLSIPLHPYLSDSQVERVAAALKAATHA